MGGAVITNTIIGDSALINLVIDGLLKPDYLIPLLMARRAPTQKAMDDACSMSNVLFIPFRAQLLVKTLCLVLLFSAGMPILLPLLLLFCLTAWPMDRLHLLARFAPPPLTNALTLRFVLNVWLPPFLVLHAVFGSLMFLAADAANGYTYAETFARGPLACYVCFTVALTAFVVAQAHAAKRRARRHGVLTPYQLCCAPCVVDDGFHLASTAATERIGGLGVALPDLEAARALYRQPNWTVRGADDASAADLPPKSLWRTRNAHSQSSTNVATRLSAVSAFARNVTPSKRQGNEDASSKDIDAGEQTITYHV